MAVGGFQEAKRALVKVLLTIAAVYSVRLDLTRDSPDDALCKAFKKVALKAHPDKDGLLYIVSTCRVIPLDLLNTVVLVC